MRGGRVTPLARMWAKGWPSRPMAFVNYAEVHVPNRTTLATGVAKRRVRSQGHNGGPWAPPGRDSPALREYSDRHLMEG